MDENDESQPLLERPSTQESTGCCGRKFRFFCTLALVLMFFKGGDEMASATRKQYVYAWCEEYVKASRRTVPNNESNTSNNSNSCAQDKHFRTIEHDAQVLASDWELYFSILSAILLFLSSSVYGTLSDYLGRKPFICLSVVGFALKTTSFIIIIHFRLHIAFVFIGFTIDGICGSGYAFSLFSYTMTADITHGHKDRVLGITIIETLIGIGRCTTEFGNGYLIKATNYFYPMLIATMSAIVSICLAVFCLRETHPKLIKVQSNISIRRVQVPKCSTLVRNYIGFYVGQARNKHIFWLCFSVYFLLEFGIFGQSDPLTLYQLGSPFCWNSELIGWYNGALMVICYVFGLIMLKPMQCCIPDCVSACLGLVSSIAFYVLTAFAKTTSGLFIAVAVGIIMMLPTPILRGMASSRASGDKQGAMFAGLQSSELLCKLIASPASLVIYLYTLTTMKGAVFLALGGVNLIALIIMICLSVLLLRMDKENIHPKSDVADKQLTGPCD